MTTKKFEDKISSLAFFLCICVWVLDDPEKKAPSSRVASQERPFFHPPLYLVELKVQHFLWKDNRGEEKCNSLFYSPTALQQRTRTRDTVTKTRPLSLSSVLRVV